MVIRRDITIKNILNYNAFFQANNQRWSKCYYYDFTSNTWPEMGSLPVPTYVAAGDYHKNWGLVITGGYSGTYLDTVDVV